MTETHIDVTRHSFFQSPGQQTVRFTEHVPSKPPEHDHALCDCTVTASERPSGAPSQITDTVDLSMVLPAVGGDVTYRLTCSNHTRVGEAPEAAASRHEMNVEYGSDDALSLQFWVSWPRSPGKPKPRHGKRDEHAYFGFNVASDRLKIEIAGTGDGAYSLVDADPLDCLLSRLYFGNKVDTRRLYNGGTQPRIVDLSKIGSDALWLYESTFGWVEGMEVLPASPEVEMWWAFRTKCILIKGILAPALSENTPEAIHAALLPHQADLATALTECVVWLEGVRNNPSASLMVQATRRIAADLDRQTAAATARTTETPRHL